MIQLFFESPGEKVQGQSLYIWFIHKINGRPVSFVIGWVTALISLLVELGYYYALYGNTWNIDVVYHKLWSQADVLHIKSIVYGDSYAMESMFRRDIIVKIIIDRLGDVRVNYITQNIKDIERS
jgi:hypothetical protein